MEDRITQRTINLTRAREEVKNNKAKTSTF